MKPYVLIMGVHGFIGSALKRWLLTNVRNVEIFGLDIRPFKSPDKNFFLSDLKNQKQIIHVLSKIRPRFIFHLAGGRMEEPEKLLEANVYSTQNLLAAIAEMKDYHPRVIIPGSAAEYGQPHQRQKLIRENDPPKPTSHYGLTKLMQTSLALMYARRGLDVVVGRIFNICGAGTTEAFALGKFAKDIALIESGKKEKRVTTRSLAGQRDFLDIRDVCSALWAVAGKGKKGEVYNICSQKSSSVRTLLKKMISLSRERGIVIDEQKASSSGSFDAVGSNTKIKKNTGWRPKVRLKESLKDTLNYYRRCEFS